MSDPVRDPDDQVIYTWYPQPRDTHTGHRIADMLDKRPVQTRDYPWWPLEILMRIAAKKVNKLPDRLVRGVEKKPGFDDYEIGYRSDITPDGF